MALKKSATHYKQKTNIPRYHTTNLLKTRFWFLVCKKGQKEDKSKFATKYVELQLQFSCKNISQIASNNEPPAS